MKLNYKKTVYVGFAFFLICAFWQAYDTIVPMMLVNKFGMNQTWSGVIMSLDNILALFMLPLFGSISDKTKTRFGRRTPYIVLGTIAAVIAFTGLTFADNAQLNRLGDVNSTEFYSELFDLNPTVSNAEYNSIYNKDVSKTYKLQDYVSNIVCGKSYSETSETEKASVEEWYKSINKEYFKDHSSAETEYYYNGGKYFTVTSEQNNGSTAYYYIADGGAKTELKKSEISNAYSNLITTARSNYAWRETTAHPAPLIFFALLLLLTLIAMASFRSPAVALMPDVTVKPLRSQANAVINLMGTAGGMLVLVLGMVFKTGKTFNQLMKYTGFIGAVCAVIVLGLLIFIWKVKEPKWVKDMQDESAAQGLDTAVDDESKLKSGNKKLTKPELTSLILILCSVALWFIGYNAVTSKYSLYATNVLHKDYNTTLLIAQAAAIISYLPVGLVAEKIGRKRSILTGIIILTAAFTGAIFLKASSPAFILDIMFALAGIGWATINVNSFPMVVELASGSNVGKFTGYYYTASMSAQILTPILSGLLMDWAGNMNPLFYYAAFFVAMSFITMLFVKHGDSKLKNAGGKA